MASGRVAGAARRLPLRQVGLGLGGLALAVSGLFGGLAPARDATPAIKAGDVTDGGPWRVTVTRVRLFGELPPLVLDKPGDRWLAVVATVEVTATESRSDMRDIVRLVGVPGVPEQPSSVVLARDGTEVDHLNPGMPEKLGFFWEQAAASPAPTAIDVLVYGKTQRTDSLTGHLEWLDLEPRARLHLPVDDQRAR